jgi:hypothetical protein
MFFCAYLHKKPQGIAKSLRAILTWTTPGATRKKHFLGPRKALGFGCPALYAKTSQKHQGLAAVG